MKQKCSYLSSCVNPDDVELFDNLSAEAPDRDIYFSTDYGEGLYEPGLGTDWLTWIGTGTGTGTTPTDAATTASNNQVVSAAGINPASGVSRTPATNADAPGSSGSGGTNGAGKPSGVGNPGPPSAYTYCNQEQTATAKTPGGCEVSVTIPACKVIAASPTVANAIAASQAQNAAAVAAKGGLALNECDHLPRGKCGCAYSFKFQASGGVPPYTYSTDSIYPPPTGLTLDDDGTLHGTPSGIFSQYLDIVVEDSSVDASGNPRPVKCVFKCLIAADGPCIYPCGTLSG
jgi:hypothetical protein